MGCATGVVKYFVFFANLIFALAGLALVIIGVLYKVKYSEATGALPSEFGLAPVLSIIIGAVIFVTSFLGCCGAVRESPCMLTTYAIILLTIFIIQVAIGVYAFLKIKDEQGFRRTINDGLTKTFDQYGRNEEATETVNVIQSLLQCCGVHGPDEYENRFHNDSLPNSCCSNLKEGYSCKKDMSHHYYKDSCAFRLYDMVMSGGTILGGTAIGVCLVELIGAFFGLCLANSIKNQYRRSLYA